mmetsp:Transcript_7000/g.14018  ORF Transcript_7000/g.14018 Transcript_7000/m.14018 type:complete len:376 (+) Transcript_7000:500-1627(+)|eukprot:CAMPEP_0171516792 /NCGR_PEP_ID=MMETSP0959-20130129/4255_1 /TAXON_ID=87120 /ORGANISM="Aurantiochytrium limacinum, Strain ATCCMYA-1381" /LENGTH=375 /DNA_ID=CAMNT_0012055585 /DNA_START=435 /DNA_END=1562 /DNA_ORIENTATION=-
MTASSPISVPQLPSEMRALASKGNQFRYKAVTCLCELVPSHSAGRCRIEETQNPSSELFGLRLNLPSVSETVSGVNRRQRWLAHLGISEADLDNIPVSRQMVCWTHFRAQCFEFDVNMKRRRMKKRVPIYEGANELDIVDANFKGGRGRTEKAVLVTPDVSFPEKTVSVSTNTNTLLTPVDCSAGLRSMRTSHRGAQTRRKEQSKSTHRRRSSRNTKSHFQIPESIEKEEVLHTVVEQSLLHQADTQVHKVFNEILLGESPRSCTSSNSTDQAGSIPKSPSSTKEQENIQINEILHSVGDIWTSAAQILDLEAQLEQLRTEHKKSIEKITTRLKVQEKEHSRAIKTLKRDVTSLQKEKDSLTYQLASARRKASRV